MEPRFIILKSKAGTHFVNASQILHMYSSDDRAGQTVIVFAKDTAIIVEEKPIDIAKMIISGHQES